MITASIVIYSSDRAELSRVLDCVRCSTVGRVYVVDNSPTDALRSFVQGVDPKITYLFGHGNIGYGSGHNLAINQAIEGGARYHVVVNPDIYFEQGAIERLADFMDQHPDVGQVMPRVVYPNGELQYLCKLLPTPMDLIGRRFVPIKSYVERRNERFEMRASGYDKTMDVPFLSGCFMFLRASALEKVGGFDDHYFMYCEDIDLCRRIGMAGYRTLFYPEVTVVHAHKKESFKSRAMLKAHIKSAVRYFGKWGWLVDRYRRQTNRRARQQYEIPR